MGTLSTSVNEGLVFHDLEVSSVPRFNEFPGAGESREPLGHDTDQHAGPGQVQTNQAQDKEAEGERQVRRLVVEGLHEHGRVAVLLPLPQVQNLRPGIIAGSGGQPSTRRPDRELTKDELANRALQRSEARARRQQMLERLGQTVERASGQ
jgi:hypothetical protein